MTISDYLTKTCNFLGLTSDEFTLEIEESEIFVRVNITLKKSDSNNILINQETISAIEHLLRITFQKDGELRKLVLDVNGQKKEEEEKFLQDIKEMALEILKTQQEQVLKNLNSYQRYLVHTFISNSKELEGLMTQSQTVGTQRWLTIKPTQDKD